MHTVRVLSVTLDTNILLGFLDPDIDPHGVSDVGRILRQCFDYRSVDLKITTAVTADMARDTNQQRREAIALRIQNSFSVVGGGYVGEDFQPADEVEQRNLGELRQVLFPSLREADPHFENKMNDVHHLHRHIRTGRNVFVTHDKDILSKKAVLKSSFGALIMTPAECASYLESLHAQATFPNMTHPSRPDYHSPALQGRVTFDFTNNNSNFSIGTGDLLFSTHWSGHSEGAMYIYTDSTNLESLVLAENVRRPQDLKPYEYYDATSRVRELRKNLDIAILKNAKGFFAIKILDIGVTPRSGKRNLLTFEYTIQPNGTSSFKGLRA